MKSVILMLFAILLVLLGIFGGVMMCFGADSYFFVVLAIAATSLGLLLGIAALVETFLKTQRKNEDEGVKKEIKESAESIAQKNKD